MNKQQFLTLVLPWLLVVLLTSILVIITFQPKPEITVLPPDNRIDSLHHIVDSLDKQVIKLRHDYDSAQDNIRTEIEYIRITNAKDITNIPNLTTAQRDSMWATFKP